MNMKTRFSERENNYKWIVLIVATLSQMCASFVIFGMGPMAAFYQKAYQLSQFEAGMIVSTANIGPIFSMILFGNLMDKYGEKWVVGLGSILLGLNIFIAYFIDSYIVLLINLLFVGIWYGTAQPGGSSAIVKWFPGKYRGLAMGIRQTGIPIGGALAAALLPFVFYFYGLPGTVLLQGIIAIIGGLVFLIAYKNRDEGHHQKQRFTLKEKLALIQNNTRLYPVFFVGISMVSVQLVIVAHLIGYLSANLHLSLETAGALLSLSMFGGMVGRIALAWVSDSFFHGNRSKPLQMTIWATVLVIICLLLMPAYAPVWAVGIICFFFGFLGIGWYSLFIVMIAENTDKTYIGLTVSVALTINQLFIVASPALFGFLVDQFNGYGLPLILLAAAIAAGGIWLYKSEQH